MVFALFLFIHLLLLTDVLGQEDGLLFPLNLENEANEPNEEFIFEDVVPPFRNEKEGRFLEALVVEAGRHVLFPELYTIEKETEDSQLSSEEKEVNRGIKYFEMKGQPEIEESYLNRRLRSDKIKCPTECPFYKPVCGTDGKVYPSECHMLKENCGIANVSIGDWNKCHGNHYLCPTRCLDLNEPVCGSDLKIYQNICIMRKTNCGKLLQKLPLSVCYERFNQGQEMECPLKCPPVSRPVCGSNGVIYFNECFLKMRTCKEGIEQVSIENCAFIQKCPEICLPIYDPVCGSDGSLYTNHCRMLQTNCGKDIKKMPASFCNSGHSRK